MDVYGLWGRSETPHLSSKILMIALGLGLSGPAAADRFVRRCWNAAPGIHNVEDFEFDSENMRA